MLQNVGGSEWVRPQLALGYEESYIAFQKPLAQRVLSRKPSAFVCVRVLRERVRVRALCIHSLTP